MIALQQIFYTSLLLGVSWHIFQTWEGFKDYHNKQKSQFLESVKNNKGNVTLVALILLQLLSLGLLDVLLSMKKSQTGISEEYERQVSLL